MNRREILLGGAAAVTVAGFPLRASAADDVVIGVVYPMSGSNAQIGVDARHAFETALDIINNVHALDLPGAKNAGLAKLGGAKIRLVFADHQGDPQKAAPKPNASSRRKKSPPLSARSTPPFPRRSAPPASVTRFPMWRRTAHPPACIAVV